MKQLIALFTIGVFIMLWGIGCGRKPDGKKQQSTALRFTMKSLGGEEVNLAKYAGKVVLIVNVASKCGYTSQYEQLQELHEKYSKQGLAILGFPCNQFLGQEPGSAEEIKQFCSLNYGVTFDMFAKVDVKGEKACDLYRLLTSLETTPKRAGKIGWNFEKFILDRNGFVVARFSSGTKPDAPEVVSIIEAELAKKADSADAGASSDPGKPLELNLAEYAWKNRIIVIFGESQNDVAYQSFREKWDGRREETSDRDLLLVTIFEDGDSHIGESSITRASAKKLRSEFQAEPHTMTFVLIGKDGTEKLRKAEVDLDEIFEIIDTMPMRKREMRAKAQG
jgi:glutathione peroxidase